MQRLRLFGSALTDRFDPEQSDFDFPVDFDERTEHPFDAYFGLREDLESLLGADVDLVVSSAVRNPHLGAAVFEVAEDVYAA